MPDFRRICNPSLVQKDFDQRGIAEIILNKKNSQAHAG